MCGVSSYRLFAELVQVHLGTRIRLSATPAAPQWEEIFGISKEQTLVAVCFAAMRALPDEQRPADKSLCMEWLGYTTRIIQKNRLLDLRTKEALAYFRKNGFSCCVLKGQGVGRLYPQPELRMPGDIDVWLVGGRRRVYGFSQAQLGQITGVCYHHIHFPMFEDVEVEAHIHPSYLSHPLLNKRLQAFCKAYQPKGDDTVPALAFDRVYILLHCYRHLCGHGVGLRQFLDYYFVLRQGFTEEERKAALREIGRLRMSRFAKATMWVLQAVFGLEDRFLLCEPDEREGRFLLSEIFQTGNMGHSDTRFDWTRRTHLGRFLMKLRWNRHLLSRYPHETLWEPFFSTALFVYRRCKGFV